MANSIDKRIVEMQFDNSRFEKNVNQSISTLDKLKEALDFSKNTKSFEDLEKSANKIDLSGLEQSISKIEHRFSALGIAGATVISTLTQKAMGAVGKLNSAVFGQMKSGGISRALNLEHANFMMEGLLKDADKVAEVMGSDGPVQKAVKGTAYGLDAAASAAAQFVASGVTDLHKLEEALTGISGVAAMTGASYEEIASIFTTVAGQGKVMTMQLRQIEARGLNAAAALGEYLNKSEAEIRDMVSKGKISFEDFSNAMNKAFGDQAKKANETFTGALSNVKAALSRIGAKVAAPTIENLRVIFVKLIDVIDNTSKTLQPLIDFINNAFYSISEGIALFLSKTGDIDNIVSNIVDTIGNAIKLVYSFILPIKRALEDFIPPATIKSIEELTAKINDFVHGLVLGAEQMVTVRRIFRGVFGVFDIAVQLISGLVRALLPAGSSISKFLGSFANGAATIGDYIYAISQVLRETDAFYQFFSKIKEKVVDGITLIASKLGIFKGAVDSIKNIKFSGGGILDHIKSMVETFKKDAGPMKSFGDIFVGVFGAIGKVISAVSPLLGSFVGMIGRALGELANGFEQAFNGGGFRTLMSLISGGLLASLAVDLAYFINNIVGTFSRGVGLIAGVRGVLTQLTNTLKVTQTKIKSEALLNLAKAIGILVASIAVLALLDTGKCAQSIAMITIVMGELLGMTYAIEKFSKTWQANGALLSAGVMFVGLAASVLILAGAMKQIASIPSDKLMDSLGVLTALLGELLIVALALSATEAKIKTGAMTLIELSVAVRILASAVNAFGKMDTNQMIQGLVGVTVALIGLAGAAAAIGATNFGFFDGAGILMMAAALNVVGAAIEKIGSLPVDTLSHGLIAIGAALAEIAVFMTVMGDATHLIGTAAAIGILALAIQGIANAMNTIGSMDAGSLTTSLIGMGVALGEVGLALYLLSSNAIGCLGAAAAIGVLALALDALIPALSFFANATEDQFTQAIGGLTAELVILGVAAAAFGYGAPYIMLGAAAIAAVGAACLLSAAAVAATAIAIEFMADAFERLATVSWGDMLGGLGKLVVVFTALGVMGVVIAPLAISMTLLSIAMGVLSLACIGIAASITVAAFGISMLATAIQEFANISPETIAKAIDVLRQTIIGLVDACWLLAPISPILVLIGIGVLSLGAGALMAATSLVIFAEALSALSPIIQEIYPAFEQFTIYLVQNFDQIMVFLSNGLVELSALLLKGVAEIFAGIIKLLVDGFTNMLNTIVYWAGELLKAFGVPKEWVDAGVNLVQGFINGIGEGIKDAVDKVKELGQSVIDELKDILKIHSPSEVTEEIGELFDEGWGNGVSKLGDWVIEKVAEVGEGMIEQAKSDANKVADVWEATIKYYGRNLEFDVGLKNGTWISAGGQYINTKTGQEKNLVTGYDSSKTRSAINSINQEKTALGGNSKAAKANTKAKEENEKANDGKTSAIDEETESLGEETEATNENEEAIREMAEQIEVVTEKYKELNAWQGWYNRFKNVGKTFVAMGNAWSKSYKDIETKANGTKTVLTHTSKEISYFFNTAKQDVVKTTQYVKKGLYAFDMDTGKYEKKMTKRLKNMSKSTKSISKAVQESGKMIIKTYEGYAKVYTKLGGGKTDKMTIRLTKNVKNLGKYALEAANFVKTFNDNVKGAQYVEDFTSNLRKIENYFVKRQNMPKKVQNYLGDILSYFNKDFKQSMNILAKNIDGIGDYWKKGTQSTAYVADSFVQLAATLYDGSEAANEYWTEIARLQFLVNEGLASPEELEAAYVGYLERAVEALKEYKAQLDETIGNQFNPFEEFDQKMEDQTKDLLKCLESQIAGFNNWGDMLNALAQRGANFNLVKELADQGVESYGIVKNLLGMTASELALYNKYYMMIDSVKQKASDAALAAVANARTMASLRAAAKSGKLSEKQMNRQRNLAKRMTEDIKSVANAEVYYNNMSKKEEKAYLATLSKKEKKEYKKEKKAAKKAKKEQERLAAEEEARRKEESRVQTIMDTIKGYDTLIKVINEYNNDTNVMTKVNEKLEESLGGVFKNLGKGTNVTQAWLKFADQLGAEGEDSESYFNSLKSTIESFRDGIKDALYDITKAFEEFKQDTDKKLNLNKMFSNTISQARASRLFGAYIEKMANMGYNSQIIEYIGKKFSSDQAGALAEMAQMVNATRQEITNLNASFKAYSDAMEKSMKQADQAVVRSQQDPQKAAFEAAQKRYQTAQDNLKKLTEDEKDTGRGMAQLYKILNENKNNKNWKTAITSPVNEGGYKKNSWKAELINSQFNSQLKQIIGLSGISTKTKLEYAKKLANQYGISDYDLDYYGRQKKRLEERIAELKKSGESANSSRIQMLQSQLNQVNEMYKKSVPGQIALLEEQYQKELAAAKAEAANASAAYQRAQKIWQEEQALRARLEAERKAQEAYENALIDVAGLIEKFDELTAAIGKARWSTDYIRRTYVKLNAAIAPVANAVAFAKERFADFEGTSKSALKDLSALEEGFFRLASTLDASNDEAGNLIDNLGARLEAYRKTLYDTIKGQVQLFDEFKKYSGDEATSADTYLDNMASQINGLSEWLTNLETLAKRGVSGDILQLFAAEGQGSFEKVAAFANATDAQLGELISQYRKYIDLTDEAADRALAAIGASYSDKAQDAANALVDVFKSTGMERVKDAAYEAGAMVITGVKDGIGHEMPSIISAVEKTAEEVTSKLATGISASQVTSAVVAGLNDVDKAIAATMSVTLSGFYDSITEQAVTKFKMAVDEINQYVTEQLATDYTITIHVDTSEIDAAVARMNEAIAMTNASAGQTSQAYATSQANQQSTSTDTSNTIPATNVTNVTLNQTNNSPKSLSQVEIYRDTQNALNQIKNTLDIANMGG